MSSIRPTPPADDGASSITSGGSSFIQGFELLHHPAAPRTFLAQELPPLEWDDKLPPILSF